MLRRKPFDAAAAGRRLDRIFTQAAGRAPGKSVQALVESDRLGLRFVNRKEADTQPFHAASVGKLLTATLLFRLAGQGKLKLDDPIGNYFDASELQGLFVRDRRDCVADVTASQLLGHTSGIGDYFGDPVRSGRSFQALVIEEPDTFWTPAALLDFTRERQQAVGRPGEKFHYSDTGYILLGRLAEIASGQPFGLQLSEAFFTPLGMDRSCLMFHTEPRTAPERKLAPLWLNGVDISRYRSLSCDWAGGGIVTTAEDLVKFYRALRENKLIEPTALQAMETMRHKFNRGIFYGLGMMEIRFGEFFFLLGNLPRPRGHIGVTGVHLLYDPAHDAYIVMNFGSTALMVHSFKTLIAVEATLKKLARNR